MSDPAQLAKATREHLSQALNALQTAEDAPLPLLDLAEPIAASMGVLHRIERSGGADLTGREKVLENVRKCLDALQQMAGDHPAVDQVMESIAGSLAKASALSRAAAKAPAAAAPAAAAPATPAAAAMAPAAVPTKPGPSQPGVPKATPGARPLSGTLPLQAAPASPGYAPGGAAAVTPVPIPLVQPTAKASATAPGLSAQATFDPTRPHPVRVEPAAPPQPQALGFQPTVPLQAFPDPMPAQPAPQPVQQAPVHVGFSAQQPVQPQPAPQQQQQRASAPQAAMQAGMMAQQPPQQAPAPRASQPVVPAPRPSERSGSTVNVELGTRSASNFYKGLAGNDVIEHGGIFVATYKIPAVGAAVRLRVLLPGDYEFTADALVQWSREASSGDAEPGFGARFTNIGQEGRQLVYRYTRNREPIFYDDL